MNAHVLRHVQPQINQYLSVIDRVSLSCTSKRLVWQNVLKTEVVTETIRIAGRIFRTLNKMEHGEICNSIHLCYVDTDSALVVNVANNVCTIRVSQCTKDVKTTVETMRLSTHDFDAICKSLLKHDSIINKHSILPAARFELAPSVKRNRS